MTEKAAKEHVSRQVQARRSKIGQLTSMVKHVEQLMEDDANVDIIKNILRVDFSDLLKEFTNIKCALQGLMDEDEFLHDQKN